MGLNPDTGSSHLFVITCTMCLINKTVFPSPQRRAWSIVSAQLMFIKWMNIFTCHPLTKSERELPYFSETLRPLVWRRRLGKRQWWYQNAPLRLREDTALGCMPLQSRGRWPWGRMMGCSCKRLGVWKPLRSAGGSRSTVGNQCNWWGPRAHSPLLFLYSLLRWSNSTTWLHIILCKAKLIFTTLLLLRGSPQLMVPLSFQVLRPKLLCCPWYLSFAYIYIWSVDQSCWLYLQNIFGILPIQHPGSSTILGLDFQSRLFTGLCLSSLATLMSVQTQMPLWLH